MKFVSLENFDNLIKGKKVALIGPADYVNKELPPEHGSFIDSHDVVVKVNGMLKSPARNIDTFYGRRLDILISSFWFTPSKDFELNKDLSNDPNYVCERYYLKENYIFNQGSVLLIEVPPRNKFKDNIYSPNEEFFNTLSSLEHCSPPAPRHEAALSFLNKICPNPKTPTTGILSVAHILLAKPQKLYVSGFTFYKQVGHQAYYDNYHHSSNILTTNQYKTFETAGVFSKTSGHSLPPEQKQFEFLIKNNIITVDDFIFKAYS